MNTPAKACEGRFSEEVLGVLEKNRDRAQWANYACEVCGALVGAARDKGKWVPEQHWPSVKYSPRNAKKGNSSAGRMAPEDPAVVAGSTYR